MSLTTHHRTAEAEAPILDAFAERWSTRIYDATAPLDEQALASALEAARWAASGMNWQPWRFIVARRGTDAHAKVVETLAGFNKAWAPAAAALVVVLAETTQPNGDPNPWAVFDTGQATGAFLVQAHESGLHGHAMGGFDHDGIRAAFDLAPTLEPQAVIAIGEIGDVDAADQAILAREQGPRDRRPAAESVLVND